MWYSRLKARFSPWLGLYHNTLTPAATPRLGPCHNTLTLARTPRPGLCHNTLTPARTPKLGLCHNTLTPSRTSMLGLCHNALILARTPRGLFSAIISSLQNDIHTPEMETNPLKTACSCPCGRVMKTVTSTILSSHPKECIYRRTTTYILGDPPGVQLGYGTQYKINTSPNLLLFLWLIRWQDWPLITQRVENGVLSCEAIDNMDDFLQRARRRRKRSRCRTYGKSWSGLTRQNMQERKRQSGISETEIEQAVITMLTMTHHCPCQDYFQLQ